MRVWLPLDVQLAQAGLLLAFAGLWVGALTWLPPVRRLDRAVFRTINRLPSVPALDYCLWCTTHLGSAWGGVAVLALSALLQRPRLTVITALGLLTLGLCIGIAKTLTRRKRPFVQIVGTRVIGLRPADLSYPSGHTAMAFYLSTFLALGLPLAPPARVGLYVLAILVGYSRLHLGVHYPFDVLAGGLLGTGWGLLWVSYLYR
ncbi:MAG: phosphatase PAP2 family protein [Anaerolineae bacterium]